jgi:hypothetical protein
MGLSSSPTVHTKSISHVPVGGNVVAALGHLPHLALKQEKE